MLEKDAVYNFLINGFQTKIAQQFFSKTLSRSLISSWPIKKLWTAHVSCEYLFIFFYL